jgi:hypothetical protein
MISQCPQATRQRTKGEFLTFLSLLAEFIYFFFSFSLKGNFFLSKIFFPRELNFLR